MENNRLVYSAFFLQKFILIDCVCDIDSIVYTYCKYIQIYL